MIVKLNDKQIAKFPEYVRHYIQIGLNTEPINFEKSKKALELCYKQGELIPPEKMIYCVSPLTAILTINILRKMKNIKEDLSDSVRDSVWNSVGNSVRDSVGNSVWNSVRDSVGNSVWNSVWNSVRDSVWNSVWNSKLDFVYSTLEGQHNVGFVSFYQFLRKECGLTKETEKMTGIFELAETTGWVYLFKDIAFICDRPCKLYRDERGRLHSDDCAALEYSDGFKIYSWHGTRVPEYVIINPEKITMEDILTEKNQEIRRVKIMKFGVNHQLP